VNVLEGKYKIGVIERIEGVPKVNQKDGHGYFSYFIYMRSWNTSSDNADYLLSNLLDGTQTRMYYDDVRYWVICPNTSEVTTLPLPTHMDLSLYLHTDISPQTIYTVLEALEFGKVNSIQYITDETDETDKNKYENQTVWKGVKKEVWQEKVNSTYNTIHIHFDYWYHTKSAFEFQQELSDNKSVDIPIDNSTKWTFYGITPMLKGGNPFIFYPNPIPPTTPAPALAIAPALGDIKSKHVHIHPHPNDTDPNDTDYYFDDSDRYMRFYDANGIEECDHSFGDDYSDDGDRDMRFYDENGVEEFW
jgi:hypothetical protein